MREGEEVEEEEEKRREATRQGREEAEKVGARSERRDEGSTRWEEGRNGSPYAPKCAFNGFCVNKQVDESKPII